MSNTGSQYKLSLHCSTGCDFTWSSQLELVAARGIENLMLPAAAEMDCNSIYQITTVCIFYKSYNLAYRF